MKLKFEKNKTDEIVVSVNGNSFSAENYIEMIKQLRGGTKIEVEFGNTITSEEQASVNKMVKTINSINTKGEVVDNKKVPADEISYPEEEINPEDIPF